MLGLSYKVDIDDDCESPSFELIALLQERGAVVSYCDPYIPFTRPGRKHDLGLASVPFTPDEFAKYDAVVVSRPHSQFKAPEPYANVRLVVDSRNIVARNKSTRVVRA